MPNLLEMGTPRHGELHTYDGSVPPMNATLERTDDGICAAVTWTDYETPHAGWFFDTSRSGRNIRDRPSRPVPKRLLFRDSHGSVQLVGCWTSGYHSNVQGPGSGLVWARYAVLGVTVDVDFTEIGGLRTEVSGLRRWMGVSSLEEADIWSEDDSRSWTLTASARPPIIATEVPRLSLRPVYRPVREMNGFTVEDKVFVESTTEGPVDWATALEHGHLGLRDLLVISNWKAYRTVVIGAMRDDDPLTTLDGQTHGRQWREVVPRRIEELPEESVIDRYLVEFDDIGVEGVRKWFELRSEFARAFDPVISTRYLDRASPLTLLAQTGPGIEALGYLLHLRDGLSARAAKESDLKSRLNRVLVDVGGCLPFDGDEWAASTVRAYNGLKHANRKMPADLDLINRWRETVLAIRGWVALELGVTPEVLKPRLAQDAQAFAFEPVG